MPFQGAERSTMVCSIAIGGNKIPKADIALPGILGIEFLNNGRNG